MVLSVHTTKHAQTRKCAAAGASSPCAMGETYACFDMLTDG